MVVSEAYLRKLSISGRCKSLKLDQGDIVTQAAWDYIRDHKIVIEKQVTCKDRVEKPEHMTQLRDNLLVIKSDPAIELRGKLDSLQAKLLEVQIIAQRYQLSDLVAELEELIQFSRKILLSEVKNSLFEWETLLSMDAEKLRYESHHPLNGHQFPEYKMGEMAIWLNTARTQIREAELAAIRAFVKVNGNVERPDLIQALNRMSSAMYILYCRQVGKE